MPVCLNNVAKLSYPNRRVIVVDNPAIDGTTLDIASEFPEHQIIVNAIDGGYCQGCNLGLDVALAHQADYILILDQNTVLAPAALETFLALASKNERLGLANPKTYFVQENQQAPYRLLYAGSWAHHLPVEQKLRGVNQPDTGQYDDPCQVDYVWGHALFMRAETLRQIGLFDEDFYMYYEDLDLARRAREAGYEVWYTPNTQAWYHGPDMGGYQNFTISDWFYKLQSRRIFCRKYYGSFPGELLGIASLVYLSLQSFRQRFWLSGLKLYQVWLMTLFLKRIDLSNSS